MAVINKTSSPRKADPSTWSFQWVDESHPDRKQVEAFIKSVFNCRYGASVGYFSETLIGCKDANGNWVAAMGFSPLHHRGAYLEQYLSSPVEQVVSQKCGDSGQSLRVPRWEVVEVGNLAALYPGSARFLVRKMTEYLFKRHFRWVVFTATNELLNAFRRLGYAPVELAEARREKLPMRGENWGTYYETHPRVMCGDAVAAHSEMSNACI